MVGRPGWLDVCLAVGRPLLSDLAGQRGDAAMQVSGVVGGGAPLVHRRCLGRISMRLVEERAADEGGRQGSRKPWVFGARRRGRL